VAPSAVALSLASEVVVESTVVEVEDTVVDDLLVEA
jgi:hypothetical protein